MTQSTLAQEQRKSFNLFDARYYPLLLCVFVTLWMLAMTPGVPGLLHKSYTDNFTQIIRLTETPWWSSHGWMPQFNAPYGMVLHWTFPISVLLLLLSLPFVPLVGWPAAAVIGGSLGSFVCYLVVAVGVYRLARLVATPGLALGAAMVVMASRFVMEYGMLSRPDHHMLALALVTWFWVMLGEMDCGGRPRRAAVWAGVMAGMALWATPETLPGIVLGLGLQSWLRLVLPVDAMPAVAQDHGAAVGNGLHRPDLLLMIMWLGVLAIGIAIDPPYEGMFSFQQDRLSVVHWLFAFCTGLLVLGRVPLRDWLLRTAHDRLLNQVLALMLLGLVSAGSFLIMFPNAPAGALNHVDPRLHDWIAQIREMAPIFTTDGLLAGLYTPIVGLIALWIIMQDQWEGEKRLRLDLLGGMGALLVLTLAGWLHLRFSYYPAVAAAPAIALFLAWLSRPSARAKSVISNASSGTASLTTGSSAPIELVVAILLGAPIIMSQINGTLYEIIPGAYEESDLFAQQPMGQEACEAYPMVDYLAALEPVLERAAHKHAPLIMMMGQNGTPAMVQRTGFYGVSGPYHRNTRGLLDEAKVYGSKAIADVREVLDRRGVDLIAVCVKVVLEHPEFKRPAVYQWALDGGDEAYAPVLQVPGYWVVLARRGLLGPWAPIIRRDEDAEKADAIARNRRGNLRDKGNQASVGRASAGGVSLGNDQ